MQKISKYMLDILVSTSLFQNMFLSRDELKSSFDSELLSIFIFNLIFIFLSRTPFTDLFIQNQANEDDFNIKHQWVAFLMYLFFLLGINTALCYYIDTSIKLIIAAPLFVLSSLMSLYFTWVNIKSQKSVMLLNSN